MEGHRKNQQNFRHSGKRRFPLWYQATAVLVAQMFFLETAVVAPGGRLLRRAESGPSRFQEYAVHFESSPVAQPCRNARADFVVRDPGKTRISSLALHSFLQKEPLLEDQGVPAFRESVKVVTALMSDPAGTVPMEQIGAEFTRSPGLDLGFTLLEGVQLEGRQVYMKRRTFTGRDAVTNFLLRLKASPVLKALTGGLAGVYLASAAQSPATGEEQPDWGLFWRILGISFAVSSFLVGILAKGRGLRFEITAFLTVALTMLLTYCLYTLISAVIAAFVASPVIAAAAVIIGFGIPLAVIIWTSRMGADWMESWKFTVGFFLIFGGLLTWSLAGLIPVIIAFAAANAGQLFILGLLTLGWYGLLKAVWRDEENPAFFRFIGVLLISIFFGWVLYILVTEVMTFTPVPVSSMLRSVPGLATIDTYSTVGPPAASGDSVAARRSVLTQMSLPPIPLVALTAVERIAGKIARQIKKATAAFRSRGVIIGLILILLFTACAGNVTVGAGPLESRGTPAAEIAPDVTHVAGPYGDVYSTVYRGITIRGNTREFARSVEVALDIIAAEEPAILRYVPSMIDVISGPGAEAGVDRGLCAQVYPSLPGQPATILEPCIDDSGIVAAETVYHETLHNVLEADDPDVWRPFGVLTLMEAMGLPTDAGELTDEQNEFIAYALSMEFTQVLERRNNVPHGYFSDNIQVYMGSPSSPLAQEYPGMPALYQHYKTVIVLIDDIGPWIYVFQGAEDAFEDVADRPSVYRPFTAGGIGDYYYAAGGAAAYGDPLTNEFDFTYQSETQDPTPDVGPEKPSVPAGTVIQVFENGVVQWSQDQARPFPWLAVLFDRLDDSGEGGVYSAFQEREYFSFWPGHRGYGEGAPEIHDFASRYGLGPKLSDQFEFQLDLGRGPEPVTGRFYPEGVVIWYQGQAQFAPIEAVMGLVAPYLELFDDERSQLPPDYLFSFVGLPPLHYRPYQWLEYGYGLPVTDDQL